MIFGLPLRRRRARARALVLCYHRIGDVDVDPWSLCVSPENLAQHLTALRRVGRPGRLLDIASWLHGDATLPPGLTFVLTFDDGYADVLYHAKPILDAHDVPATTFLVSARVGAESEFWWDALERILLQSGTLPPALRLRIGDHEHEWTLGDGAHYTEDEQRRFRTWSAQSDDDPTERQALYRLLYALLQTRPSDERARAIAELAAWSGSPLQARPAHRVLTLPEVRELAADELVQIGSHTRTHPVLSQASVESQRDELAGSRAELEALLGTAVHTFAYPHGAYTQATISIARSSGFRCACTTRGPLVEERCDPYELPRLAVPDCDGEAFERRFLRSLPA